MGIEKHGVEMLAVLKAREVSFGRFLMLGRQHFHLSGKDVKRLESRVGFPIADLLEGKPDETYAEPFLRRLGAKEIDSIDYSEYEGCTLTHDMNQAIPRNLEGEYDVVYDGGTLEHVFNFPVAIENCMKMVKEGGVFLTVTGSNNFNGHGFYQFSPELYYRIFSPDNGFEIQFLALGETSQDGKLFAVEDGKLLGHRVGFNFGKKPLLLLMAARKTKVKSAFKVFPSQSDYVAGWATSMNGAVTRDAAVPSGNFLWKLTKIFSTVLPLSIQKGLKKRLSMRRKRLESLRGLRCIDSLFELNLPE